MNLNPDAIRAAVQPRLQANERLLHFPQGSLWTWEIHQIIGDENKISCFKEADLLSRYGVSCRN